MKRDNLKELGLTDEQINKVMDLNGSDIEKAKSNFNEITEENKSLKSQMEERNKDLKKLQSQLKDNEDLSGQLKELQGKYKEDTNNLTEKLHTVKLNSAIDQVLTANKVRNTKAARALLDNDAIKLNDDGTVKGLSEQLDAMKKSDPYLFDEGNKEDYHPSNGNPPEVSAAQQMIDIFKGDAK